jgi:nucleoside-diphosphate-sugar epimerase
MIVCGDGRQAYDFVEVGDCRCANVLAVKTDTTDAFYNIGRGQKTAIREFAELLKVALKEGLRLLAEWRRQSLEPGSAAKRTEIQVPSENGGLPA